MKKLINEVENVEQEMIQGLVKSRPQKLEKLEAGNIVVRKTRKQGKVALVSGGGSGHEPAHGGYVGEGMLDAAVAGPVFTSPTPDQVYEGIKAVATDAGVLCVVKNYTGDVLNFEMAVDMAKDEDIKADYVVVNDDVAVKDSLYTTGRRGVAGTILVHKIAGAKAEEGASLEEVKSVAEKVIANVRTMGMAIQPCTVPAAGKPGFELGEDEMEIGIGIHGEPGTHREKLAKANDIAKHLLDKILADIDYAGKEVVVIVNGMGDKDAIAGRIKEIRAAIDATSSDYDKEKLQERLAKLSGGVGVIKVGAATEIEMKDKKLRIEDALSATKAAVEEGIVAGGGTAFIGAMSAVEKLIETLDGDEKTGARIVLKGLEAPVLQIAANAGLEGAVIIDKVKNSEKNIGFDAYNEKYVDMFKAGIVDPAKVTRSALENAASVASMILTTESLVADIKEPAPAVPANAGGMDGMY